MKTGLHGLILFLGVTLSVLAVGCHRQGVAGKAGSPKDVPLKSYQCELLDLAFSAASAMPVEPHIKDRSRVQEMVVAACLELGQPQRALRYIEQIGDWRRGAAYADLAFYCVQHGFTRDVQSYLNLAAQIAEQAEDWRKDRIKAKIVQTHAYLGQTEAGESGRTARAEAMVCTEDSFDKTMETLETLVSTGQFDGVKNALGAYVELYGRFYANPERRATIEGKIKASWDSMPVFVHIELLAELAGFALAHADQVKALELVNEAKAIPDAADWQPQIGIPVAARLAELRFKAGDVERAHAEVQEALKLFDAKRDVIVNIYRAQVVRPIAEAYQEMDDTAAALDVYGRAIEAGMENPNSRPRAEDLAATCCSMAMHAVEPGQETLSRIRNIREDLGDPW